MTAPVLIFGATGGVGATLARQLVQDKTPVFLAGRSTDRLTALTQEIDAPCAVCNVTDAAQIAETVQRAASSGALAGLAFCVGSIVLKPLKTVTEADFIDAFRLNVVGAALALKAARSALLAGNGAVVLFSTVAVAQGFTNHTVISAAKGGIEGLTRAAAAELAPRVRVNAIAPSLTQTPLAQHLTQNEKMASSIADLHAIPRLGRPEDVAAMAKFLLSPESSWMTGQIVAVDGGRSRVRTRG